MPSVAVVMITYNHEAFIAQSIESVFAQRYDGLIHLIVSDDCSTDRTQAAIAQTVASAPANVVVHPVLRTSNVGGLKNLSDAWAMAHETGSSYIALLEGDDYWTDPQKLALQVGYLEQHPSTTLSFGLAAELIYYEASPTFDLVIGPSTTRPTFDELLCYGNFSQTPTMLYRAGILPTFPEWFAECKIRDWPLNLVHARAGDMHYLDRVVAVHRQHAGGRWSAMPDRDRLTSVKAIQRLAIAQLAPTRRVARRRLVAAHHAWRAAFSSNSGERYMHMALAGIFDPVRAVRWVRAVRRRRGYKLPSDTPSV